MGIYTPKEELLTDIYNLILDPSVEDDERIAYKKTIYYIEEKNEYYEAVLAQLLPTLVQLAQHKKLSKKGGEFMSKILYLGVNRGGAFFFFDR